MYVAQQACVSWAGIISDYFSVHNGVRQGDLFCVYIDNLLQRRSRSGVGCYLGENFAGSLAHAEILRIRDDDCLVMAEVCQRQK